MIRRLFDKVFGFLGIGYGWCGGCRDPDCMDCQIEWGHEDPEEIMEYDGFGAPIRRFQLPECLITGNAYCHLRGVRRVPTRCLGTCELRVDE